MKRAGTFCARAAATKTCANSRADPLPLAKTSDALRGGNFNQALNALEQDDVIRTALGTHTFERFLSAKRLEWEDYRLDVTPWELKEYLANY